MNRSAHQNNLLPEYDTLIVFIIGEKKDYTAKFETEGKFSFNRDKDIWDDNYLTKEIDKLGVKDLEKIKCFLEDNLVEFKLPERLFENDLKKCIQILKRDFGSKVKIGQSIVNRDDSFIENKNLINNISWEFFKSKIVGHLQYNQMIGEFLSNPINRELKNDYFDTANAIQEFYNSKENSYDSFECIFKVIFQKINTYDDDITGIDTKMKILLHNMYFNCDIGNNPTNND